MLAVVNLEQPEVGTGPAAQAADLTARMDRLPASRTIWRYVLLLSLALFFEIYEIVMTGYIAPGLTGSGILTATTPGLFGSSGIASFIASLFAGLTIGTFAAGPLADRFGRRAVLTYALLGFIVASFAMAFQHTASGVNLFRLVCGIGLGVEMIAINTYIAELVPQHLRGRAFGCSETIGFSAVPAVALLSWAVVPHAPLGLDGWRWVVLAGGVGALACWQIRRVVPESPRWLIQVGRLDEASRVIEQTEVAVRRDLGRDLPVPVLAVTAASNHSRFADIWQPPYRRRTLMLIVFNIFQTVGYFGFLNWVPTFLTTKGIHVSQSLLYAALIALAAPFGPAIGLWLGDRAERKWLIVGCAGVVALAGLGFSSTTTPIILVILGIVVTMSANLLTFAFHAYQAELFPTGVRARASGFVYAFSRVSAMFNAFLVAFMLRNFGVPSVFALFAASYGVVMVAVGCFGPLTSNRSLEEISDH